MIRIALINPSFKRSELCHSAFLEWIGNADDPLSIEYLIGLDSVDSTVGEYESIFTDSDRSKAGRFLIDIGDSTNAIQAMNRVANIMSSTVELIVVVSDDIGCFPHWDTEIFKCLSPFDNFTQPKLLYVNDGYWPYGTVLTNYIANRAFYDRLGYILCPEYTSMFSDKELTDVGRILDAFIMVPHLTFLHKHYTKGLSPFDETYARRNNQVEFSKNEAVYNDRKSRNFEL